MQRCGDEHAAREAVGHDLRAAPAHELADLACDGEAAAASEVRLQNVYVTSFDEGAEGPDARIGLARCDPHRGTVRQAPVAVVVIRRKWLFKPIKANVAESIEQVEAALHRIGMSPVEHQRPIVSEHVAGGAHELAVAAEVAAERAPAELERAVPIG